MARPCVAVLDPIAQAPMERLKRHASVIEPPLDDKMDQIDALIVRASPVPGSVIRRATRLRVIGKHGVGLDAIDLDAARARSISVFNTPAANSNAVAELTVALMLSVLRSVPAHNRALQTACDAPSKFGRELASVRVGLVGFGMIARQVAAILASGFNTKVTAFDPYAKAAKESPIAMANSLEELCGNSDVLSVHVPLTEATAQLINAEILQALPRGAVVINTSRGGVVDEGALSEALCSGHLAGAGLDVLSEDPPSTANPLLDHPNVVVTPHIGATTEEAMARMGDTVVTKVLGALGIGDPPDDPIR